jgi:hypothetical protein
MGDCRSTLVDWGQTVAPGGIMRSIEQLTEELLSLPGLSRGLLADKLVESLLLDPDPAIQQAWLATAKQRRDEIRDGSVTGIPGDEALAQVRRLYRARRQHSDFGRDAL